uniref:CDP-diacylglycerol--glycerol-3-phosphate 3-phosphatidyltransferase n=1 Tax=uncultured bacterium CSLF42 TaxID=1091574 RepID=G4WVY5_9BACT|nr:CDP-diacylglycerol--glycerol-3-phosphate 3-phosphatidyltransferase [uncultured bacterium CSLF42]
MTLANKITVLRIIAIPLFIILLLQNDLMAARILFTLSVVSDALDGAMARWRGERTPLGAFLDPMADKLLLVATYIAFTWLGEIPVWVFIVILSRDVLIVMGWSIVLILTGNRKIQPRPLGKMTTALQMAVAVAKLFSFPEILYEAGLRIMIAATILSACEYIWLGNKRLGALE